MNRMDRLFKFPWFKPNANQRSMFGVVGLGVLTGPLGFAVYSVERLTSSMPATIITGLFALLILVIYSKSGIMEAF